MVFNILYQIFPSPNCALPKYALGSHFTFPWDGSGYVATFECVPSTFLSVYFFRLMTGQPSETSAIWMPDVNVTQYFGDSGPGTMQPLAAIPAKRSLIATAVSLTLLLLVLPFRTTNQPQRMLWLHSHAPGISLWGPLGKALGLGLSEGINSALRQPQLTVGGARAAADSHGDSFHTQQFKPATHTRQAKSHLKPLVPTSLGAMVLVAGTQGALADVPPPQVYNPQLVVTAADTVPMGSTTFATEQSTTAPALTFSYPESAVWGYSDFLKAVEAGHVRLVTILQDSTRLTLRTDTGAEAQVKLPRDPDLPDFLIDNGVEVLVSAEYLEELGWGSVLLSVALPCLLVAALLWCDQQVDDISDMLDGMGGIAGNNPLGNFTQNKAKFQEVPDTGVTFEDVAGADAAKLELQELVDFLKNTQKYTKLGAKLPKGAVLVGPPGTGKTLLAQAVAGEAGVPFFSASASEFVELFVGVGASRVRDLFHRAKEKAPCIVFVDEIDAVGRSRGAGVGGGNDEREQTINQLLTEMDGFEENSGVMVLAATNRPDVLDSALTRAGRFDRQITVDYPDLDGRTAILKVHAKKKKLAPTVDLGMIARQCPGFTGADLANLLNEAAIGAARRTSKEGITEDDITRALERLQVGLEKSGATMSKEKRKLVAYHEAGHALVGSLMPGYDTVKKISIIPRGEAGGMTFFAPDEERLRSGRYTRQYLEDQMAVALGGRVAEELIFGEGQTTVGASGDFQQVTNTARLMVTQLGFSDAVGQIAVAESSGPAFLGSQLGQPLTMSQETAAVVDEEVGALVERAYRRCKDLLTRNMNCLHALAEALAANEVLDSEALAHVLKKNHAQLYTRPDAPEIVLPYQS